MKRKSTALLLAALIVFTAGCRKALPSSSTSGADPAPESGTSAPAAKPASKPKLKDGTFTATTLGFGGDITVTLTVEGGNVYEVIADGPGETPAIGGPALVALPNSIKESGTPDIDGVSGATATSDAVLEAAAHCFDQAKGAEPHRASSHTYADGTYTSAASGFGGDVTVTLTFKGGKVTDVTADGPDETPAVAGAALEALPKSIMGSGTVDLDAVSGATATSNAILTAATHCFEQAME